MLGFVDHSGDNSALGGGGARVPKERCAWCETDPLLVAYHDAEWGRPVRDDALLFEMLNLEGAQAGLSWLTVLRKREAYRKAFDGFDARKIARYDERKKAALMLDAGIVRNRAKIEAAVGNARAFLAVQKEEGSFARYLWTFVAGKPIAGAAHPKALAASEAMSRELRARGFKFVGPTICYAFMQGVGMVDDHAPGCFRHRGAKR
jgi:DNA-3-methyladenine glycosylase I